MLHIYTGDGAGKTTAAVGLALRCLGRGKRVVLVRFLKGRPSGEVAALARWENCRVISFGRREFIRGRSPGPEDIRRAQAGLAAAERTVREGSADLLILDEVNVALDLGLFPLERAEELIASCPAGIELVFTGRNCPARLLARADYATDFREIRHPYRAGQPPREGIEY